MWISTVIGIVRVLWCTEMSESEYLEMEWEETDRRLASLKQSFYLFHERFTRKEQEKAEVQIMRKHLHAEAVSIHNHRILLNLRRLSMK